MFHVILKKVNCSFNEMIFISPLSPGFLVLLSIVVFHQSVLALLASDHSIPLHHELSWSVACVGSAGAILIFGGLMFLLLSFPINPLDKCFRQQNSSDT